MKAVVIKTKGKDATLLGDDGQFVIRRNHNYKMGDMVIMKSKTISKRIVALAATAAMLVFMMSAAVVAYVTPAYYVSLDVNPSLLMKVNFFNQLIGLEAMNEDAAAIVESLDWKFKTVDDVDRKSVV